MIADVTFERTLYQNAARAFRSRHRQHRGRGRPRRRARLRDEDRYRAIAAYEHSCSATPTRLLREIPACGRSGPRRRKPACCRSFSKAIVPKKWAAR